MPRKKGSKNKKQNSIRDCQFNLKEVQSTLQTSPNLAKIIDDLTLPPSPEPQTATSSIGTTVSILETTDPTKDPLYLAMVSEGLIQDPKLTGVPEVIYNDPPPPEVTITEIPKTESPNYCHNGDGMLPNIEYKFKSNGKIDWQAMFNPEYFVYPDGDTSKDPFLKVDGLLELADIRGIESKEVVITPVSDSLIAVTVKMTFLPNREEPCGKVWSATADANPSNVGDKKFAKYLTTIAETRATGRCIRGALGIRLCSYEEISKEDMQTEDNAPIKDTTLVIIKRQMELKGMTEDEVLKAIPDKNVTSLNQLTASQGQMLVGFLNKKQNKEAK